MYGNEITWVTIIKLIGPRCFLEINNYSYNDASSRIEMPSNRIKIKVRVWVWIRAWVCVWARNNKLHW